MADIAGAWAGIRAATQSREGAAARRACLRAEFPVTKRMVAAAIEAGALEVEPLQGGKGGMGGVLVAAVRPGGVPAAVLRAYGEDFELGGMGKGTPQEVRAAAMAIAQARDAAAEDPWRASERIAVLMRVFMCVAAAGVELPRGEWPEADEKTASAIEEAATALREAEAQLGWARDDEPGRYEPESVVEPER